MRERRWASGRNGVGSMIEEARATATLASVWTLERAVVVLFGFGASVHRGGPEEDWLGPQPVEHARHRGHQGLPTSRASRAADTRGVARPRPHDGAAAVGQRQESDAS
jgi:hypothetical protein